MSSSTEIIKAENLNVAEVNVNSFPSVFVTLCAAWPDAELLAFLHSLAQQSLPSDRIHVCLSYRGEDVRVIRDLQKTQAAYEGRFKGFDLCYSNLANENAIHDEALSHCDEPYILVATPNIELDTHALYRLLTHVQDSSDEVAVWELRQKRKAGLQTSLDDLDRERIDTRCILYSRAALEKTGGFASDLEGAGQDAELDYRLRDSGYRIVQSPEACYWPSMPENSPQNSTRLPFEAWLSDQFIRLRYGDINQRLQVLRILSWPVLKGARKRHYNLLRRVSGQVIRNFGSFLRGRLPAEDFPICGWHEDFLSATRNQQIHLHDDPRRAPLVSICVRAKGGDTVHLRECLRSIANQTYPRLEVIVVEAGVRGEARKLVGRPLFGEGIEALYLQHAAGYEPAPIANMGLSAVQGAYVLFLDEEQLLFADHVQSLFSLLTQDENALGAYASCRLVENPSLKGSEASSKSGKESSKVILTRSLSQKRLAKHKSIPLCAFLFRTNALQRLDGFQNGEAEGGETALLERLLEVGQFVQGKTLTSVSRTSK